MGTPQKLKVEKIVDVFEAIKLLDDLKLDFTLSYKLGRLQDRCKSVIKVYERMQTKLQLEYGEKARQLAVTLDDKTEEEKAAINAEVRKVNNEFAIEMGNILQIEEEIVVPQFKLSDFENKDIPVKFFSLMGELINE